MIARLIFVLPHLGEDIILIPPINRLKLPIFTKLSQLQVDATTKSFAAIALTRAFCQRKALLITQCINQRQWSGVESMLKSYHIACCKTYENYSIRVGRRKNKTHEPVKRFQPWKNEAIPSVRLDIAPMHTRKKFSNVKRYAWIA